METRRTAQLVATVAERLPKEILSQILARLATLDEHSSSGERMAVSYTASQGDARELVADLIRCWNEEEPALSPRSLALALQCASEVDERHRTREEVQLIWTGPDVSNLPFRRTEQALLELVETAKKSLLIVAFAAYKIPELVEAINAVAKSGVDVVCVFESHDASGGKVSFSPLKKLGLAPSVRNFVWPMAKRPKDSLGRYGSLHAKCAVVDSSVMFLSSANLTEFAFNLNMELGIFIKGGALPGSVERHFRALIAAGHLEPIGGKTPRTPVA
jgi:phosphatidylserine/phosphatidylglycerophosphate/cardiolipin synthase-like enzyme